MGMLITNRFKYAVKKICESLGLYPPHGGGDVGPILTMNIDNQSGETINAYPISVLEGTVVYHYEDTTIEDGESRSIDTLVIGVYKVGQAYYAFALDLSSKDPILEYEGEFEFANLVNVEYDDDESIFYIIDPTQPASVDLTFTGDSPAPPPIIN